MAKDDVKLTVEATLKTDKFDTGAKNVKDTLDTLKKDVTTTAKFNVSNKKDLAKIAMSYPNVYVAQVSLGANPNQLIKAFNEATSHKGPSIIIAYAPCIEHGIKGGGVDEAQ